MELTQVIEKREELYEMYGNFAIAEINLIGDRTHLVWVWSIEENVGTSVNYQDTRDKKKDKTLTTISCEEIKSIRDYYDDHRK